MKKLVVGVGCPELIEAVNDEVGGLQCLFDVEQAINIATFVYEGSVAFIISILVYYIITLKQGIYLIQ